MKTFLVYSKKPKQFIFSVHDISSLQFVRYGFSIAYLIDLFNIFHSIRRKFFVITAMLIAVYVLFWENTALQTLFVVSIAFLAYAMEIWFLRHRRYQMIASIEAKNIKQAKELFMKNYIIGKQEIILQ